MTKQRDQWRRDHDALKIQLENQIEGLRRNNEDMKTFIDSQLQQSQLEKLEEQARRYNDLESQLNQEKLRYEARNKEYVKLEDKYKTSKEEVRQLSEELETLRTKF